MYEARLVGGPRVGARVVCKRAKDGLPPEGGRADSETLVQLLEAAPEEIELRELSMRWACPSALRLRARRAGAAERGDGAAAAGNAEGKRRPARQPPPFPPPSPFRLTPLARL